METAKAVSLSDLQERDEIKVVSDMGSFSAVILTIKAGTILFQLISNGEKEMVSVDELKECDLYPIGDTIENMQVRFLEAEEMGEVPLTEEDPEKLEKLCDRFFELYEIYKHTGIGEGKEYYNEMIMLAEKTNLHGAMAQVRTDKTNIIKERDSKVKLEEQVDVSKIINTISDERLQAFKKAYDEYEGLGADDDSSKLAAEYYEIMAKVVQDYPQFGDALEAIQQERKKYLSQSSTVKTVNKNAPSKEKIALDEDTDEFQALYLAYKALAPIPSKHGSLIYGRMKDIADRRLQLKDVLADIIAERNAAIKDNLARAKEYEENSVDESL